MCGIAGIISDKSELYIKSMTDAIAHRGPDDFGYSQFKNLALGHRRLSIQDLSSNGHQPMQSQDGRYVLVFNGEIYNHWDIRKDIEHKYPFKSHSDTETILYGFEEYGVELFNRLNGIFVFAILDKESQKLTIVRDHFGIKPLYYTHNQHYTAFGSELKALTQLPDFDPEIDSNTLANYLYFLWSPGENTPFIQIKKLLPGHYLQVSLKNPTSLEIAPYYELPFSGNYALKSEVEWINTLDIALQKAVERQLLSDVPLGFFLSGGLDSSLIVAIAKKLRPDQTFNCYTIESLTHSSREGFADDLPYAKSVAAHLNVPLHIVKADVDIVRDFDAMVYHLDEPQADAAPLNVLNICALARKNGDIVLLGGTAGDDLFSGYRRHQFLHYSKKLSPIPNILKRAIFKMSSLMPNIALKRRIQKVFGVYHYSDATEQMASLYGWMQETEVHKLFSGKIERFKPINFLKKSLNAIPSEKSSLNQMLFWDLKFFLADHNLNYTDKMSMAHGVEVRVPFLDKELVDLACRIPPELKMKGDTTKYILKKVAERYLPHDIIYRPKTGFGAPVRDWIIDDLNDKINTELSKDALDKGGIFDYNAVKKLIEDNKNGKIDAAYPIWALLAIQSWMRQFIN